MRDTNVCSDDMFDTQKVQLCKIIIQFIILSLQVYFSRLKLHFAGFPA